MYIGYLVCRAQIETNCDLVMVFEYSVMITNEISGIIMKLLSCYGVYNNASLMYDQP